MREIIVALMARLIRWISGLGRRLFLPLQRRLSLPPLSSLLLYIQAVVMMIAFFQRPIWAFWYGTPLSGDRSLLGLYEDYVHTPASVCSIWVKAAWDNDLAMKRIVIAFQYVLASVFGMFYLYWGATSSKNSGIEEQDVDAHDRRVLMIICWFFLAGAIVIHAALRFEEWMAGRQEQDDNDGVRARRTMDRLDYLNSFENWDPEEDMVQRNWERRGAISEQGGLGPGRFGQEVELRERFAYVYPQA